MSECTQPNYIYWNKQKNQFEFLTHKKASLFDTFQKMPIPCGRCKNCLENSKLIYYQKNLFELQTAKTSYFITLTYDQEHYGRPSANIDDLKEFIIKIKKYFYNNYKYKNFRYFGVSEYGSQTNRKHFHLLIYNLPITDNDYKILKLDPKIKYNHIHQIENNYFTNDFIKSFWGKGNILISGVNEARIKYLVNYLEKSFNYLDKKTKIFLFQNHIEQPKHITSQNLGKEFILQNAKKFINNEPIYINGVEINSNKYIDEKLKINTNERMLNRLSKRIEKHSYLKSLRKFDNHSIKINNNKGTL